MVVGERLKAIRESKKMSQGDIERETGLLRCYISRVENGHTVPAIETLEKITRSMGVTMSQLFSEGGHAPEPLDLPRPRGRKLSRKDATIVEKLIDAVARMNDRDKSILVNLARKMASR
jgi:transcriptional regulator with XRE-family HTH domain